MNKFKLILIGIIIVAAVLRVWGLGDVPASPDWDEASLGYNAYSILQTGRDEYGELLPLTFRSFNDFKPGLYTYFIIPFLFIFDLSLLAVRLPSAILGILTVLAVYFLVKELFRNKSLALLTSFLLAISPWHIQFSRVAFESNAGLAFNVFAVLFFLKGLKKPMFLLLSAAFAGANLYMYQSEKLFTPLLILLLAVIYRRQLFALSKKYLTSAVLLGVIISMPFIMSLIGGEALSRAQGTSVFQQKNEMTQKYVHRLEYSAAHNDPIGMIFNNRRVVYAKQAANGYLSHFNLNWLFITGDNPRHHAPNMGLLYLWELPFLLIGIYSLIYYSKNKKKYTQEKALIFGWFLLAPLPAAFTIDTPHAVRTLNFLPTFQIFIGLGLIASFYFLKNKTNQFVLISVGLILSGFALFNFVYYLNQYFVQYNPESSQDWQYGYEEAVEFTEQVKHDYDRVVVSDQFPLDQSYIFFLFYSKYPPAQFQSDVQSYAQRGENREFGVYQFRKVNFGDITEGNTLYVVSGDIETSGSRRVLKEVPYLDGSPAIKIIERAD